jgi:type VI protein secretion system component VasK
VATVADLTGRLRHLCRLVARDRQPYCPVNGLLVLLPLAATDSDDDAQNTAESCGRDLQTVRAALKVDCPLLAMVCDLEMLPGFREFFQRQKPTDLLKRVGQRFPMGTDLRGEPLAEALEGAVGWLCLNTLRDWVYRLFRVEQAGREDAAAAVSANSRLYLMLSELREREARLARILTRGVLAGWEGAPRFGGCYLGATGAEASQQAFVPGVFRRLTEAQNYVAWTDQARADDARYQRLANLGYGILAGLGVLAVAAVAWSVLNAGPRGGPQ